LRFVFVDADLIPNRLRRRCRFQCFGAQQFAFVVQDLSGELRGLQSALVGAGQNQRRRDVGRGGCAQNIPQLLASIGSERTLRVRLAGLPVFGNSVPEDINFHS
jgi:hypothetical protein